MFGTLDDSSTVDFEMDVYMQVEDLFSEHSAFVDGDWIFGPISTSSDGFFSDDRFEMVIVDTVGFVRTDTLRGNWKEGAWLVEVILSCQGGGGSDRPGAVSPCAAERRRIGQLDVEPIGQ